MKTFTLTHGVNSQLFTGVVITFRKNDVVKRTAADGTDMSLILGFWRGWKIEFSYLSDTEFAFIKNWYSAASKSITIDSQTYDIGNATMNESEFKKSEYELKIQAKNRETV